MTTTPEPAYMPDPPTPGPKITFTCPECGQIYEIAGEYVTTRTRTIQKLSSCRRRGCPGEPTR